MGKELVVLRKKYRMVREVLDERGRRIRGAAEARSLPRGGVSLVAKATGLSRTTIHAGIGELQVGRGKAPATGRSRRVGGGRKPLTFHHPDLLQALEQLVEPLARGDPESFLRWTSKSTRQLAAELQRQGYRIGDRKVAQLLHRMGYSLQANAKTLEGGQHPDRNAQFEYVQAQTKTFLQQGLPVISVDTKKKKLVGNYSNRGQALTGFSYECICRLVHESFPSLSRIEYRFWRPSLCNSKQQMSRDGASATSSVK